MIKKYVIGILLSFLPLFCLINGKSKPKEKEDIYRVSQEGIAIEVHPLTNEESKQKLTKDLLSRGFQPIQITIDNPTATELFLSMKGVDLPQVSSGVAVSKVAHSSVARSMFYSIAGFFFWPIKIAGNINSISTMSSEKSFKKQLVAHTVKVVPEAIPPYSKVERMVLVKGKQFKRPFTLTFTDKQGKKSHTFNVG